MAKGRPRHNISGDAKHRGKKLAKKRKERHFNQQELADLLGVNKDTISGWENGREKRGLSDENIAKIHKQLAVSKNYFDERRPVKKQPSSPTPDYSNVNSSKTIATTNILTNRDLHVSHMTSLSSPAKEEYIRESRRHKQAIKNTCEQYFDLANLEKRSLEELAELTDEYIKSYKDISLNVPVNSQILIYSKATKNSLGVGQIWPHWEELSRRPTPIVFNILGINTRVPQDIYWIKEFNHLKRQFDEHIEDIIKSNTTSNLHVFALVPQPLVVELGHLLTNISDVEIRQPYRNNDFMRKGFRPPINRRTRWDWREPYPELEYLPREAKTKENIVVLNLSLNTLIKKSMIERVLGSELSIWTLTIEEPENDFLQNKKQLIDFKESFRNILDNILGAHGNCIELHVFLSVPIAIAFEIGRVWDPDYDPNLILYGLSSESGDYYPIHTIKKNQ